MKSHGLVFHYTGTSFFFSINLKKNANHLEVSIKTTIFALRRISTVT
jgi:hypothetical protein